MRWMLAIFVLLACSCHPAGVREPVAPRVVTFYNTSHSCSRPEPLTVMVEGETLAEVAPGASHELTLAPGKQLLARGADGIVRAVRHVRDVGIAYRGCAHPVHLSPHQHRVSLRVMNHSHACAPGRHSAVRWMLNGEHLAQLAPGDEAIRYASPGVHRLTLSGGPGLSHRRLSLEKGSADLALTAGCGGAVGTEGTVARLTVMRGEGVCKTSGIMHVKVAGTMSELGAGQGVTRILPLGGHLVQWRTDGDDPKQQRLELGPRGLVWRPPCP